MKKIILSLFLLSPIFLFSQATEANLLGHWEDNSLTPTSWLDGRYNDVWGAEINGVEYAIIGSTEGTHFLSLADPANPEEVAFIQGTATGPSLVHRDVKIYQHYAIAVADEGNSTLQIIDMSDLPNGVSVVYDSNELINQSHNIFIDEPNARLYAIGGNANGSSFRVRIISLENPADPEQLSTFPGGNITIPSTHDIYVKDHIGYINCGNNGFWVVDFTDPNEAVLLGTMTDYPQAGYNHSGWLSKDGKYYFLCDETHGSDVKVVDVSDFSDMNVVALMNAESTNNQIAHNAYVVGDLLYVSYYYDGLQVFDVSNPLEPQRLKYYDTFDGDSDGSYQGAWGIFVMSSGMALLSDMNNGFYVFDKIIGPTAYNITVDESEFTLCEGEGLSFNICVGYGFEEAVDLTNTGLPPGALIEYSENPATPGSIVEVSVFDLLGGTEMELEISGTDDVNTGTTAVDVAVVFAPEIPQLMEPANEATQVVVQPNFVWSDQNNMDAYLIEISSSLDDFSDNLIYTEEVSENSFATPAELAHLTSYFWRVSAENPCGYSISEIYTFETQELVNVKEVAGSQFQIFPNPVQTDLSIQFEKALNQNIQVEMLTATGQVLLSQNVGNGATNFTVEVVDLPKGMYFLRMKDETNVVARKVIVE